MQKGSLETHTNSKQNEKEYAGPHRSDSNFLYFCVHLLGVRIAVVFSGAKKSRHHKDVWIFVLSEGCDITYRCHACAWNCRVIEPNGFDPTYESPKKETIRMDGFLWYPNTIDQLLTRTGILRRLRRLRVASAFVLTAGQNQRHCIPLPCLRMELPGDRTQWVRSDIRITKKETIRMDGFFFGDPYGNTPPTASAPCRLGICFDRRSKPAALHTAAMLAHGIAGRSNPMGSVRHTNHQKRNHPDGWFLFW